MGQTETLRRMCIPPLSGITFVSPRDSNYKHERLPKLHHILDILICDVPTEKSNKNNCTEIYNCSKTVHLQNGRYVSMVKTSLLFLLFVTFTTKYCKMLTALAFHTVHCELPLPSMQVVRVRY